MLKGSSEKLRIHPRKSRRITQFDAIHTSYRGSQIQGCLSLRFAVSERGDSQAGAAAGGGAFAVGFSHVLSLIVRTLGVRRCGSTAQKDAALIRCFIISNSVS